MRIAMLDPSAFTIPYDVHLCSALTQNQSEVIFYTRPIREADYYSRSLRDGNGASTGDYRVVEHFYHMSERVRRTVPLASLHLAAKTLEHVFDMYRLQRSLALEEVDVIHFQWMVVPAIDRHFIRTFRKSAPVLATVHDTGAFVAATSELQKKGWQRALQDFDGLIVHTQGGKSKLCDLRIPEDRISVIPHGIFNYANVSGAPSCRRTGKERFTLLFFGAIKPYKGVDVLLRAVALLPLQLRQIVRVVIAGNPGQSERELRSQAVALGIDDILNWRLAFVPDDEVAALFESCDAVVFPYREIDASGALMTALPYGKPLIASRLGLFEELLEHGNTAQLVTPNDPAALANAIATVATDPQEAQAMGQRAARISSDVLGWNNIARLTLDAYRHAFSNRQRELSTG